MATLRTRPPARRVPIIARRGELVVPPERVVREEKTAADRNLTRRAVDVMALNGHQPGILA